MVWDRETYWVVISKVCLAFDSIACLVRGFDIK